MSKHQHFHVPVQLTAVSLVVFAVHLARSILPEPARSAYPRVRALACLVRAANVGQGHGLDWLRQRLWEALEGTNLGLASPVAQENRAPAAEGVSSPCRCAFSVPAVS